MPANTVKSFAEKTGKSVAEVEKLWDKAKEVASEAGETENFAYITGILKKMLGLNESTSSFKEFLEQEAKEKELAKAKSE
jgi:hypothetical protein